MFNKFIAVTFALSSLLVSAQAFARADDTKTVAEPEAKQAREQKYFGREIANDGTPAEAAPAQKPAAPKKHRKPASDDSTQTPAEAGD